MTPQDEIRRLRALVGELAQHVDLQELAVPTIEENIEELERNLVSRDTTGRLSPS